MTPATTATLTPEPNSNGWNNANVTVALNAVDIRAGPALRRVSYSATGAQPIAPTPVTGASASIAINVEGQTTIVYYAAKQRRDRSRAQRDGQPRQDPSGNRVCGKSGHLWRLDTVNITCTASDSLSGLLLNTCADISGPAWQFSLTGTPSPRPRWTSPAM